MGLLDFILNRIGQSAFGAVVARLGLAGFVGVATTAFAAFESATKSAMRYSASQEAIPPSSSDRAMLDSIINYGSGVGKYGEDYSYYDADYLQAAIRDGQASNGIISLIRLKRSFHGDNLRFSEGALFLIVTRQTALLSRDSYDIVAAAVMHNGAASSAAADAFLQSFLEAYLPMLKARQLRIQQMQGHPRFGSRMMPM